MVNKEMSLEAIGAKVESGKLVSMRKQVLS